MTLLRKIWAAVEETQSHGRKKYARVYWGSYSRSEMLDAMSEVNFWSAYSAKQCPGMVLEVSWDV